MLVSAILLSALALCTPAQSSTGFERELRVREAAWDPAASADWLDRALARSSGTPWTETADALEALARALDARAEYDIERWRPALLRLTGDAHATLRAGAWRVLARSPKDAALSRKFSGGVSTWEERTERARAIARCGGDCSELEALCSDGDARVAGLALAEWMQSPARDDERAATVWMQAFEAALSSSDEREVRLLELLELAPRAAAIATRVVALTDERRAAAADDSTWIEALCLAAAARQLGSLPEAALARLCEDWDRASRRSPGARSLLARAARCLGPALGERLTRQACERASDLEAVSNAFAGAVEALEPTRLLEIVGPRLREHPALGELLLDRLRGRVDAWQPDSLAAWLAPELAPSQRAHTMLVVAETFRQSRDPGSAQILLEALLDPDASIASEAFQGLAGAADPTPWMDSLHACWSRRPSAWQAARLGDLSREIAWVPFRSDLLELASKSRTSTGRVAELLAAFRGDSEVASALREWLEQDLARLREFPRGTPESEQVSDVISSALSLVRAFVLVAGEAATPSLFEVLEACRGRSLELGKTTIFQLGRSEAGRRGLVPWISSATPSRLRAEAALALAPHPGRESAIRVLLEDYAHYDEDLRGRALRAFAQADDDASAARLASVVRDLDSGASELLTAVECLCARAVKSPATIDKLFGWLEQDQLDSEPRTLIIAELGRQGSKLVHARLAALLARLETRRVPRIDTTREAEERALERESLIAALARANEVDAIADQVPCEIPLERAAAVFAARASGQHQAEVEFTWRAELELISAFARAGRLEQVLDRVAGWRGLDARLLLECAARTAEIATSKLDGAPGASERLALAAVIALEGESDVDDTLRARFEARRKALEAARARGDHPAFAARAAQLERDVRSGVIPAWVFARAYGSYDPQAGVDALGRLACDIHLARARIALAAKDSIRAKQEVLEARECRGASQAALEAILALEQELRSR